MLLVWSETDGNVLLLLSLLLLLSVSFFHHFSDAALFTPMYSTQASLYAYPAPNMPQLSPQQSQVFNQSPLGAVIPAGHLPPGATFTHIPTASGPLYDDDRSPDWAIILPPTNPCSPSYIGTLVHRSLRKVLTTSKLCQQLLPSKVFQPTSSRTTYSVS